MPSSSLLHHLLDRAAERTPEATALKCRNAAITYAELAAMQDRVAAGISATNAPRSARVALYASKSFEWVAAAFGAAKAGCCFVPINPILRPNQVAHIVGDCDVEILVTSRERWLSLRETLRDCPSVRHVIVTGAAPPADANATYTLHGWDDFCSARLVSGATGSDNDMAAIFYTSGSTGMPKGVVVSHRNLVTGAASVASYLGNHPGDRLLAVLPVSFDAGFSQLTTAFHSGASAVLLDYTLASEVVATLAREQITGLTAVPPLYAQLAQLEWPSSVREHLRYFANTGGKMPRELLSRLRARVPTAQPFLMYGLTEAFRSTFLPPSEVEKRPDSIGKAIPNQEVLVLRQDGTPCAPNETGELVHRGSTVSLGYWGDAERTAERFRPLPPRQPGLMLPELAVFSGDYVRMDEDGFLYFIGRRDDMIKSSGYRISPVEIEEAIYATQLVSEAAAVGLPDENLGQKVAAVVVPVDGAAFGVAALLAKLAKSLPQYMLPLHVEVRREMLPRNGNGKIDRRRLSDELTQNATPKAFAEATA